MLLVFCLSVWDPDTDPAGNNIVECNGHNGRGVIIRIRVIRVRPAAGCSGQKKHQAENHASQPSITRQIHLYALTLQKSPGAEHFRMCSCRHQNISRNLGRHLKFLIYFAAPLGAELSAFGPDIQGAIRPAACLIPMYSASPKAKVSSSARPIELQSVYCFDAMMNGRPLVPYEIGHKRQSAKALPDFIKNMRPARASDNSLRSSLSTPRIWQQ
jgi:hypothetical protein